MMNYREYSKVVFLLHSLILTLFLLQCVSCQTSFPVRHYLEMGCDPIEEDGVVQAYDCLFEHVDNYTDSCIYKGELLNIEDRVPNVGCNFGCFCYRPDENSKATFMCAVADCFFRSNNSCIEQYKLGGCCRYNEVCGPKEIKKLSKCKFGSQTYYEGQLFYPASSCMQCVCAAGFSGDLKPPYCQPVDCAIELYAANYIQSRCAPVYYQGRECCPIQWECYNDKVKIMENEDSCEASEYQCTFGSEMLNIGDKVIVADPCTTCTCVHPPLVTCIKSNNCTKT